jgi:hypothetical protein
MLKLRNYLLMKFCENFQYWSHYVILKPQSVVLVNGEHDTISERYYKEFEGHWMQCEYFMSYKNLTTFLIRINTGDNETTIAFKDFQSNRF